MDRVLTTQSTPSTELFHEVFEHLAMAVVVVDREGAVVARNVHASELLGAKVDAPAARCCDFLACARATHGRSRTRGCITEAALQPGGSLKRVISLAGERQVRVAATPVSLGVMLQIRPLTEDGVAEPASPPLRISALGNLELEWCGTALGGVWVHQRPGQVLRYLITARGRRVPVEELVDAIWPGSFRAGVISLRKSVHTLRERLEPERTSQAPPRFIVASPGAYVLDMDHVVIDADEFEAQALAALRAVDRGASAAEEHLECAIARYRGDFLADDHYGDWSLAERDRLRSLALRTLGRLAELHQAAGRLSEAVGALERVVALEPLDSGNQRQLMTLLLRTGGHASAARRYETFRRGFGRAFGTEPDFALAELMPRAAVAASAIR
jgi:DNA-binding SARP family transcriptional activator